MNYISDDILAVIEKELEYAYNLPENRTNYDPKKVGEYCTMLAVYVQQAQEQWVKNAGDQAALHEIRKIAAIALRCLAEHGVPERPLNNLTRKEAALREIEERSS